MSGTIVGPVVCPILVGRAAEVSALTQIVGDVEAGRGRVVMIAGEAGIGKTRLLDELKVIADRRQRPWVTLTGSCFASDRSVPFGPLLDLARSAETPDRAALTDLVAALTASGDAGQRYHEITSLLLQLAGQAPLLLVIEDLHWSDDASLDFLRSFARRLREQPVLLALSYRSDEVNRDLLSLLAALDRERLAVELALAPLDRNDVAAMVGAILQGERRKAKGEGSVWGSGRVGDPAAPPGSLTPTLSLAREREQDAPVQPSAFSLQPSQETLSPAGERERDAPIQPSAFSLQPSKAVAAVAPLAEGNPLLVEEVMRALLVDQGDPLLATVQIPRTIAALVESRVADLRPEVRRLLDLAAVAGRRFEFDLLQAISSAGESELIAGVRDLVAAQLIVEESAEIYRFRHALVREAIVRRLLVRERRALHRRIAAVIEGRDDAIADLAYHLREAEDWSKLCDVAPRAAAWASRLHAPRAALEHYGVALMAFERTGRRPPAELIRAWAGTLELLGEFDRALAGYQSALAAAQDAADVRAQCRIWLDLGFLWSSRDYAESRACLDRAEQLARAIDDLETLASITNRLGNWFINTETPAEAVRRHREALVIYQRLGDRAGQAATLDLLAISSYAALDTAGGAEAFEQAITLFRALDDRRGLASALGAHVMRAGNALNATVMPIDVPFARCLTESEEAIRLARQAGWRSGEPWALGFLAIGLGPHGRLAQALAAARQAVEIANEIEHPFSITYAHFALGTVLLELAEFDGARQALQRAYDLATGMRMPFLITAARAYLGLALIEQRRLDEATALLDTPPVGPPGAIVGQRLLWTVRAELALAASDPNRALAILETLSRLPGDPAVPWLALLRARALTDDRASAIRALEGGITNARRFDLLPMLLRLLSALAHQQRAIGDRAASETTASEARRLIDQLAADIDDSTLAGRFRSTGLSRLPSAPTLTPNRAAKQQYDGLTGREREIAGLIAAGKSNREIADSLYLSERTVDGHVGNILSKLGFRSRAQVAAWAVEKRVKSEE